MEKESKHSLECNYLVPCTSQNNLRTKILWLLYEKKENGAWCFLCSPLK